MKERPILFKGPMVRAILEGRKTQTRRVVTPTPWEVLPPDKGLPPWPHGFKFKEGSDTYGDPFQMSCPYGVPGDRLWVRETAIIAPFATPDETCVKDAYGNLRFIQYVASHPNTEAAEWYKLKKTPSIFMPRWASRITLEVTDVRCERVADISRADAIAEGCTGYRADDEQGGIDPFRDVEPEEEFAELWDSINGERDEGKYALKNSPWVWVITFSKL